MGCCFSCCYGSKQKDRKPKYYDYQEIDTKIYKETEIINSSGKSLSSIQKPVATRTPQKSPQQLALKSPQQAALKSPQQQQLSVKKTPLKSSAETWKDIEDAKRRSYQNEDADRLDAETTLYFSAMETPLVRKRSTSSENLFNINASLKRLRHNNKTSIFEINTISQKIAYRGPLLSTKSNSPMKFPTRIAASSVHEVTIDLNGLNIKDAIQVVNSSMSFYSNRKINKLDHLTKKVVITYLLEKEPEVLSPVNHNTVSNRNVMPNIEHRAILTPATSSSGTGGGSLKKSLSNSSLSSLSTTGRTQNQYSSNAAEYRNLGYQLFEYLEEKGVDEVELINKGTLKVAVTPRSK